jgi:hypothetical protein
VLSWPCSMTTPRQGRSSSDLRLVQARHSWHPHRRQDTTDQSSAHLPRTSTLTSRCVFPACHSSVDDCGVGTQPHHPSCRRRRITQPHPATSRAKLYHARLGGLRATSWPPRRPIWCGYRSDQCVHTLRNECPSPQANASPCLYILSPPHPRAEFFSSSLSLTKVQGSISAYHG